MIIEALIRGTSKGVFSTGRWGVAACLGGASCRSPPSARLAAAAAVWWVENHPGFMATKAADLKTVCLWSSPDLYSGLDLIPQNMLIVLIIHVHMRHFFSFDSKEKPF